MQAYRSLATIKAVQYQGDPILNITCDGNRDKYGCDSNRAHLPHVHTRAVGGITVLKPGDWIMPSEGGPYAVAEDGNFRACYQVDPDVRGSDGSVMPPALIDSAYYFANKS